MPVICSLLASIFYVMFVPYNNSGPKLIFFFTSTVQSKCHPPLGFSSFILGFCYLVYANKMVG